MTNILFSTQSLEIIIKNWKVKGKTIYKFTAPQTPKIIQIGFLVSHNIFKLSYFIILQCPHSVLIHGTAELRPPLCKERLLHCVHKPEVKGE